MKKEEIEAKLLAYIDGELSPAEWEQVKVHLQAEGHDLAEFQEMTMIWQNMEQLDTPSPSANMRNQFYENLASFKAEENSKANGFLSQVRQALQQLFAQNWAKQAAFGISFLVFGIVVGYQMRGNESLGRLEDMAMEMQDMKKVMMISMMEQESASKRIKAVNMVHTMSDVDEKVINTLFKSLNEDRNVNVRMVAAEALQEFTDRPTVRTRLIEAIAAQESPLVQLTLVDVLLALSNQEANEALKGLMKDELVNEEVRKKAARGLGVSL